MILSDRIRIPPLTALSMFGRYARERLIEQFRSVIFIVLYLILFQILITGAMPGQAWRVAAGIGMTVLGLTLFLEGLLIALMPLGEQVGVKLPQLRAGFGIIVAFGLLLGIGSTLAEPAIAALRAMGGSIKAWEAPLLFHLLENASWNLVIAISIGVGAAVATGMVRLFFSLSLKPFVYVVIPLLLVVSLYSAWDDNLRTILGLAWDSGAVTTGAVTVPLVLALGIGVSRTIGRNDSGFGIIMLASAFPVFSVLILGILLNTGLPPPMPETDFFDPANRVAALRLFHSETDVRRHAWTFGSEEGRRSFEETPEAYHAALESLRYPASRQVLIGSLSVSQWGNTRASEAEKSWAATVRTRNAPSSAPDIPIPFQRIVREEAHAALRAVLPLTALLLIALWGVLHARFRYPDELALGIALCFLGMAGLSTGIQTGLVPLGDSVGTAMPRVFRAEAHETKRIILDPFDPHDAFTVYRSDGQTERWFYRQDHLGAWHRERFDPNRFDAVNQRYEHIVLQRPLFQPNLTFAGVGLAFLFAFGLGYGSSLAEPALRALGLKVKQISVGTISSSGVVHAVSIGVGMGLLGGIARILYDIPLLWLLAPPYLLLIPLTRLSEEDYAGMAWDCGGVTTGVVTVPLVMAMGLGIGGEMGAADGFGALALASVYPILTVMLYGLAIRYRQRRAMRMLGEEAIHA